MRSATALISGALRQTRKALSSPMATGWPTWKRRAAAFPAPAIGSRNAARKSCASALDKNSSVASARSRSVAIVSGQRVASPSQGSRLARATRCAERETSERKRALTSSRQSGINLGEALELAERGEPAQTKTEVRFFESGPVERASQDRWPIEQSSVVAKARG